MNEDDLNGWMDDFSEDDESDDLSKKMQIFHDKMRAKSMMEAYRFINDVGILFWVRNDMYVKKSRKLNILDKMVKYYEDIEEFEKCAYLMKGIDKLRSEKDPDYSMKA